MKCNGHRPSVSHVKWPLNALLGKNRQLVTDEPIEFEELQVEVGDFRRITDRFKRIYGRIYLK